MLSGETAVSGEPAVSGGRDASVTTDATPKAHVTHPARQEPFQSGCIEADPFVMWVAVTFVTIVTILYFFLRGVKRPVLRDKG